MKFLGSSAAALVAAAGLRSAGAALTLSRGPAHLDVPDQNSKPAQNSTPAATAAPADAAPHRARLDVGFKDYETKLLEQVGATINGSAFGKRLSKESLRNCTSNVSLAVSQVLKEQLQPLKQSIGQTWMALPKDEQKDGYVSTLRKAFLPVLDGSMKTVTGHLGASLKRLDVHTAPGKIRSEGTQTSMLAACQDDLRDTLVGEHCYEDALSKKAASKSAAAKKALLMQLEEAKQFCIPSVIHGLAHRLNDTQGLISMSMRFDAGALSFAQGSKPRAL